MDNVAAVGYNNVQPAAESKTVRKTSTLDNKRPVAAKRTDVNTSSSLDTRRPVPENRTVKTTTSSLDGKRPAVGSARTNSAVNSRTNTAENNSTLDSRPQNRKRKQKTKDDKNKTKKKRKNRCCCFGDKVSGTETNMESETDADRDSDPSQSGCCSCCCPAKAKNKSKKRKRKKSKQASCVTCCKKVTTFFFSHIGLCSLVVAYSVFGGFVFMKLEAPHEVKERSSVSSLRQEKVSRLWNITEELNILHQQNWSAIAEKVFLDFQVEVFQATKHRGWDGKDGETELQWSFAGALLYSVTVITTIGYGHITPKTPYGRLVTIFYALIGIPLTLLCLANMGSFLGNCFRCFYKQLCIFLMWLCCPPQSKSRSRSKKNPELRYNREGLSDEVHPLRAKSIDGDNDVTIVMTEEVEEEKPMKHEPVRVPIIVSFLIVSSYIFGGAVIFSWWEKDWDYLIGSYFCFITLSTIGFGDYVPGSGLNSWSSQEKLIFCCLYLVFGLSVIAMCFNLMQEEVMAKCRWLGKKLGILDEDET